MTRRMIADLGAGSAFAAHWLDIQGGGAIRGRVAAPYQVRELVHG